jgi:hypothetical protein
VTTGRAVRTCLHCALARALRAESAALAAAGLAVRLGPFAPVLLPLSGAHVYRQLRRLLTAVRGEASGGVKVAVLDLRGKSHVEVTATVARGGGAAVLSCTFARFDPAALPLGFAEGVAPR